jgi:hypothetical protein
VGTVGRPLEVELGPLGVADRLAVLVGDRLGGTVTAVPPEVDILITEGNVLVTTSRVREPRTEVVTLDVGPLAPSNGELTLANRHGSETLNIAETVHVELVLTEHGTIKATQSVLGLLPVGVGKEKEALVGLALPGHVDVVLLNGGTKLGEELDKTGNKLVLPRLVNDGSVVDNKDILKALLGVDGKPAKS